MYMHVLTHFFSLFLLFCFFALLCIVLYCVVLPEWRINFIIAEADDAAVERWMGRDDGVDVQRLREATLFSFSSAADMLLFERLLSHGLTIRPCVCV